MKIEIPKDETLRRYLLDDLADAEREEIEADFFEDDSFFQEMLALEDELRYDYQQNRLSPNERAVFEKKFLSTAQDRKKNAFAEAFLQATAELAEEKAAEESQKVTIFPRASWRQSFLAFFDFRVSGLQFGLAAATILFAVGLGFLFFQNAQLRREMAILENNRAEELQRQEQIIAEKQRQQADLEQQLTVERQQREQDEARIREIETNRSRLEQEIAEARRRLEQTPPSPIFSPTPPQQQRAIIAFSLAPGLLNRSGGAVNNRIKLSPAVKTLQIRLQLKGENEYQSYRAAVNNIDGGEVWTGFISKAQRKGAKKSVSLSIPASVLKRADYELLLVGVTAGGQTEEIDSYYFSVLK